MITGLDTAAGLLVSGLVEAISPPITSQSGILKTAVEAGLQLGTIIYLSMEVSQLIHRDMRSDPTKGLAYQWSVFLGMPNTLAKIAMVGAWGRTQVRSLISQSPIPSVQANTAVPPSPTN